ncbi:MAG TPA: restriction endonuclease [Phycisphaerae bacterium]|nr:restriction endonuclease [Phycisphaerae bacterium]
MEVEESQILDPAIVEHFTGQQLIRDPGEARRQLEDATGALCQAKVERCRARRERIRSTVGCILARTALICCRISLKVQNLGWSPALAALIGAGLWAVLGAVLLSLLAPHSLWVLAIFFILVAIGGVLLFRVFVNKDVERAAARVEAARQGRLLAKATHERAEANVRELATQEQSARAVYQGLLRAADSQLNTLINADIDHMDGTEFERYLESVFTALGYRVQHTGQSGDQGVDLIVQTATARVAVQAKCWQASVGNSAVQEVHAGKVYYQCDACAVVTNSYFTESARMLAAAVGCQLVEGKDFPALIRGRIRLGSGDSK